MDENGKLLCKGNEIDSLLRVQHVSASEWSGLGGSELCGWGGGSCIKTGSMSSQLQHKISGASAH